MAASMALGDYRYILDSWPNVKNLTLDEIKTAIENLWQSTNDPIIWVFPILIRAHSETEVFGWSWPSPLWGEWYSFNYYLYTIAQWALRTWVWCSCGLAYWITAGSKGQSLQYRSVSVANLHLPSWSPSKRCNAKSSSSITVLNLRVANCDKPKFRPRKRLKLRSGLTRPGIFGFNYDICRIKE